MALSQQPPLSPGNPHVGNCIALVSTGKMPTNQLNLLGYQKKKEATFSLFDDLEPFALERRKKSPAGQRDRV